MGLWRTSATRRAATGGCTLGCSRCCTRRDGRCWDWLGCGRGAITCCCPVDRSSEKGTYCKESVKAAVDMAGKSEDWSKGRSMVMAVAMNKGNAKTMRSHMRAEYGDTVWEGEDPPAVDESRP